MEVTKTDAITELEAREKHYSTVEDEHYHAKMAGYLTALYDLGFLSWNEIREYEKKYRVGVFLDE